MSKKNTLPNIPYDIYESPEEIVIIVPLGGIDKNTIDVSLRDYQLIITGERKPYDLKDNLIEIKKDCYRGPIQLSIHIPPLVYFDKIHSKLTPDNILEIIVPKSLIPEKIALEIQHDK